MTLSEAARIALQAGCELEPSADGRRLTIRSIAYDADPYELDVNRLTSLSAEEFRREWIPPRYEAP